ncbi:hypothetical protein B0H16DRAFT_539368 [Mycena metata]|uniref:Uncharacterized protein n=1 Tax=Mycena metata TaxID=1033252 RepID=A0AAD7NGW3_9AGAR|nr:hypothetical protein B0H16DRAFT_539368 [Mycena metata]
MHSGYIARAMIFSAWSPLHGALTLFFRNRSQIVAPFETFAPFVTFISFLPLPVVFILDSRLSCNIL